MTSYISLLNKIEAFCNAHLQIKKYKGEFKEQMPNFSTMDEKYPIVFIVPTSDSETLELNQFTLDIYCVDIIQKNRGNLNTIVSDCHLILKDLYLYFKDGSDLSVDVIADPTMTPLNNFDLDYVAGWVMTITFEVEGYSVCAIPMNPISPTPTPTCEDSTYSITDTDNNILYTGSIASGGTLTQPISDSTAILKDTLGTVISTTPILAEGSEDIIAPDALLHIKKENDGTITNLVLLSGSNTQYIVENNDISVNGVLEFDIHATEPLDVRLRDESNGTVTPVSVTDMGNHATIVIPNTTLEVNGTIEGTVVAGSVVDVQLSDSGGVVTPDSVTLVGTDLQIVLPDAPVAVTRSTATLMKTGQTTSYRTGDDGDLEAGRATDFHTLDVAPLHNDGTATLNTTTARFTDTLGGSTYANNWVLDWSTWNGATLLGIYRTSLGSLTWNNAIDNSLGIHSGYSGCRLPNVKEILIFARYESGGNIFNYSPLNISGNAWCSTTTTNNSANALGVISNGSITAPAKTSSVNTYTVRTFSLSLLNVLS